MNDDLYKLTRRLLGLTGGILATLDGKGDGYADGYGSDNRYVTGIGGDGRGDGTSWNYGYDGTGVGDGDGDGNGDGY